jgi:hypothetical protein
MFGKRTNKNEILFRPLRPHQTCAPPPTRPPARARTQGAMGQEDKASELERLQKENFNLKLRLREQQDALPADAQALQTQLRERDALLSKARDLISGLNDEVQLAKQQNAQHASAEAELREEVALARADLRAAQEQQEREERRDVMDEEDAKDMRPRLARWERVAILLAGKPDADVVAQRFHDLEQEAVQWREKYRNLAATAAAASGDRGGAPSASQVQAAERTLKVAGELLEGLETEHRTVTLALKKKCAQLEERNRELVRQARGGSDRLRTPVSATTPKSGSASRYGGAGAEARETPARLGALHRQAVQSLDLLDEELHTTAGLLFEAARR